MPDGGTTIVDGVTVDAGVTNYIGSNAPNSLLVITNRGGVSNGVGVVGYGIGSTNNLVLVTGSNSAWNQSGDLYVGFQGRYSTLIISNGGAVSNGIGNIGSETSPNGNYNRVVVDGPGSVWRNSSDLNVGNYGALNILVITNGGTVMAAIGRVGNASGAQGNQVVVAGSNSLWAMTSILMVGISFVTNSVVIIGGGTVSSSGGTIGGGDSSISVPNPNNRVIVSGPGSTWNSSGEVRIGNGGLFNLLLITNGGVLSSTTGIIGYGNPGDGKLGSSNQVIVDGSGSAWFNSTLTVGYYASSNKLSVTNGAMVSSTAGNIGFNPNAKMNVVSVSGSNSTWNCSGTVTVGTSGSSNTLLVSDGGAVATTNLIVGNSSFSTNNRIMISAGTLRSTNAARSGALDVRRGTNVLDAGLIVVDRLLLTNTAGFFTFNGGTLNVRTSTVANGTFFTVGDSTSTATYRMSGSNASRHSFANGLVISTNSTLTGNGTLIGSVTNFGTFSPGNSAGSLSVGGELRLRSPATLELELGGTVPTNQHDFIVVSNLVEFGGALSLLLTNGFEPVWSNRFTLLTYSNATGAFSNVASGARLSVGTNGGTLRVLYNSGSLRAGDYRRDTDADSVDDAWAQFYFAHSPLSALEKAADTDGDGRSNYEEYLAGTDPLDAASALAITSLVRNGAGVVTLQFRWLPDRAYRLEYADELSSWNVASNAALTFPAAAVAQWVDDGSLTGGLGAPTRAYRVRVVP